jgi:hypothetical protein
MTVQNQLYTQQPSARLGWSAEEDALLFEAVRRARIDGAPLKAVFDEVAGHTGRRPNSIRNYYYARVKQGGDESAQISHNPAFVPFSDDEIKRLLTTVLGAQARGVSVRACTLEMGDGDNRAMLRYQNKYRSLLKSNPALVRRVVQEMRDQGLPSYDPYEKAMPSRRAGRPRKQSGSLLDVVGGVVNQLDRVEGLDVSAFFESLGALAISAAKGAAAQQRLQALNGGEDVSLLMEENEELKAQMGNLKQELNAQRDRFSTLLGYFRQLMDVNREFLGMTSVTKVSSLSNYIRELSRNVEDCEKWMYEVTPMA